MSVTVPAVATEDATARATDAAARARKMAVAADTEKVTDAAEGTEKDTAIAMNNLQTPANEHCHRHT